MASQDVTRLLDPAPNHYVGSRAQQGRPLVDSDFNEGRRADDQDSRAAVRDLVGKKASPDDGFLPDLNVGAVVNSRLVRFGAFVQAFVLDYNLRPGTMHAGGWRFEQEDAEPVIFQREYLQMGPATAPRAALGTQRQLSYLRGWEQSITVTEDGELVEPALHGADAATRVRRMRRVEVQSVEAEDCAEAFNEVLVELGDGTTASYDAETCELRSNARLQMGFYGDAGGDCAGCDPALLGKYLGNEDHCIRIMLASASSYVWAFDNAAPLYRAKLIFDGNGATVEMLTPPKDSYHEPGLNRVVEILPWSVLLENGSPLSGNTKNKATGEKIVNEKLAARAGFFADVDAPYDPGTREFHLRIDPASLILLGAASSKAESKSLTKAKIGLKTGESPATEIVALEWDPSHPHASELNQSDPESGDLVSYVYLRIWHEKKADEPLTIATTSTAPLGRTGLVPTFGGSGRRGDFWRMSVRTEARNEILPLAIMEPGGLPPDGPLDVVVPLALLEWNSTFGIAHELVSIHDCRPNLPAITNRGCCTHIVGPGTSGEFQSIQAAVNALPPAGGRICVLPGTYRETVRVAGRGPVRITGCGLRSVIASPEDGGDALVDLQVDTDGSRIELEALAIRASGQIAILATGADIDLADLDVEVEPDAANETSSALRLLEAERVQVSNCRIRINGGFSQHAAVYVDSLSDTLIEGNRIETVGGEAWGGVQVTGGSRQVELRDNDIVGGRGHGVTIGSARFRATDGSDLGIVGAGLGQSGDQPPFLLSGRLEPVNIADSDDDVAALRYYPEPDAAIEDLLIVDNRIGDCLGSGIAALAPEVVHEDAAVVAPLCIRRTTFVVDGLTIADNLIEGNALGAPGALGVDRTRGGIVLSEVNRLDVARNHVRGNGASIDAGPVCGINLARGSHVVIADNRLSNNGQLPDGSGAMELRGGIVLKRPASLNLLGALSNDASVTDVILRGNVVENDSGPALMMVCSGHCSVLTNHLQSRTPSLPGAESWGTVVIVQPGRPWEAVDLPAGEPSPDRWTQPAGSFDYLTTGAQAVESSGGLLVADNQVSTIVPVSENPAGAIPALIFSTDSVVLTSNQFSAQLPRGSLFVHNWVIGSTVTVADNRVAEGIETTPVSLIAMAPMLTLAAGNILTHCPIIFGCENNGDDNYYVDEDNLNWFRLQQRRCEQEAENFQPVLLFLCRLLFGLGDASGDGIDDQLNSLVALRGFEP